MKVEGKAAEIIQFLFGRGASTVTDIARQTSSTYAHTVRTINRLAKEGLVKSERRGRTKLVELTEVGKRIGEQLDHIESLMELARLGTEVETLYEKEVKGRLREEVNQQRVLEVLGQISKKLEPLESKKVTMELALKLRSKVEELEREVRGLVLG
ncbi:MAG: winged helix DNA-binding protein [Candidatus Hadarchaeales archaeon]